MAGTNVQYLKMLYLKGHRFVVLGAGQRIGAPGAHALAQAGAAVRAVWVCPHSPSAAVC
jgi:NAD(P)-dependent dehydrogenase (short-subunit alcohol dehydrogenase family)